VPLARGLISLGSQLNERAASGNTVLVELLLQPLGPSALPMLQLLLERRADTEAREVKSDMTALMLACTVPATATREMETAGAGAAWIGSAQRAPLMPGRSHRAGRLLRSGRSRATAAGQRRQPPGGGPTEQHGAHGGRLQRAAALRQGAVAGARPEIARAAAVTHNPATAAQVSNVLARDSMERTVLHVAAQGGDRAALSPSLAGEPVPRAAIVAALLASEARLCLEQKAQLGFRPLHFAAAKDDVEAWRRSGRDAERRV
jgi:hypothetical protein